MVDDQSSSTFIKSTFLGSLAPNATLRKTFRLLSTGKPGERQIDLSIRVEPNFLLRSTASTSQQSSIAATKEILRTINIKTIDPFFSTFELQSFNRRKPIQKLMDLNPPTGWEGSNEVGLVVRLAACGPWEVEIMRLELVVAEVSDLLLGCRKHH